MTPAPDEPTPGLERVVDAISDGKRVEWEREAEDPAADAEKLAALQLIERVARARRGGPASTTGAGDADEGTRVWGRLVLRGPLGEGASGEVYRAYDPGLQREVALKLWSAAVQPRTIERLLEEARALARVRHPNVLLVHGADVHDGQVGMWTELVEGATLERLMQGMGTGHWREVALYGIQLARALDQLGRYGYGWKRHSPEQDRQRNAAGRQPLLEPALGLRQPAGNGPLADAQPAGHIDLCNVSLPVRPAP